MLASDGASRDNLSKLKPKNHRLGDRSGRGAPMNKLRVLILEDDRDIIDLAATALGDGFECFAAGNGLEGIQMAQRGEPDLILCDIMMPIMDGKEFVRRLRKFTGFEKTPVVYLTAMSSRDQIRDGYQTGAVLYLTKPIDPSRLKRNIELYVEDHAIVPRPKKYSIEELLFGAVDETPTPVSGRPAQSRPIAPHRIEEPRREPPRPAAPPRQPEPMARAPRMDSASTGGQTPPPRQAASETGSQSRQSAPRSDPGANPMLRNLMQSKSGTQGRKKIRVMVLTNDEDAMKIIEPRLGAAFETVETRDGIGGVETANRYKPDLMIIDGILPRMNGEQVVAMIRKTEEFFDTPIIFLSERGFIRDQHHAEQIGATICLIKPFSAAELMEAIDRIVSNPSFKIRTERIGISQAHLEQFQRREIHRSGPMPTVEQLERQHLENILKKQLK